MSSEAIVSDATLAGLPATAPPTASDGVIRVGDRAVAASPLRPGGIVTIHGRRHSARLTGTVGNITLSGTELVIVGGDNSGFLVQPATTLASVDLPRRGDPVHGSFGAAIQSAARRDVKRRETFERIRANQLRVRGLAAGTTIGCLAVAICWLWPSVSWPAEVWQAVLLLVGAPLGFGLAAVWLARQLDERFAETDSNLRGLSLLTTILMLLGAATGGAWAIPRWGLLSGVGLAAIAALFLGSPLPAIVLFAAAGGEETSIDGAGADGGAGDGDSASASESGVSA